MASPATSPAQYLALAVRVPMTAPAERLARLVRVPAFADRRRMVRELGGPSAPCASRVCPLQRAPPERRLLAARSPLRDLPCLGAAGAAATARDHRATVEAGAKHQRVLPNPLPTCVIRERVPRSEQRKTPAFAGASL